MWEWVCRQFSLLQPAGTVTTNSGMHSYVMFRLFLEKCSADRSWKFILVGPGKVMENDFPERVVTLLSILLHSILLVLGQIMLLSNGSNRLWDTYLLWAKLFTILFLLSCWIRWQNFSEIQTCSHCSLCLWLEIKAQKPGSYVVDVFRSIFHLCSLWFKLILCNIISTFIS